MKHALKRDQNEGHIFAAFRAMGASVYPMHVPCDALVGYRGVNYLVEVKTAKGKQTDVQVDFSDTWRGQYQIIRSVDEAVSWLNEVAKAQRLQTSSTLVELAMGKQA